MEITNWIVKRSLLNLTLEESLAIKLIGFMLHCFETDSITTKDTVRNKIKHIEVMTLTFKKYSGDKLASKTVLKIGIE